MELISHHFQPQPIPQKLFLLR